MNNLKPGESRIEAKIVVKDKHGNVKYQGPLVMKVATVKENENGSNPLDSRPQRSG